MSLYETPDALRRALEARLVRGATEGDSSSISRKRRGIVFESIARRLVGAEPGLWIVKGGMSLEWSLGDVARATRDLDLCVEASHPEPSAIRARLIEALSVDSVGDRFAFEVGEPEPLSADVTGRPGNRFSVMARLGARRFENVKLDVVPRVDELLFVVEIEMASALAFAGVPSLRVHAAAPVQQFAEKLHALTRVHGDRPNTRARDLVDLTLLIERTGLDPGQAALAVAHVFRVCDTHPVPAAIPDPPFAWKERYPAEASESGVYARNLDDAMRTLREFWDLVAHPPGGGNG